MSWPRVPTISGRTALVTGAGRGIGRAIAVALAEEGCSVALLARSAEELDETARQCQGHGVQTLCLPADMMAPFARYGIFDGGLRAGFRTGCQYIPT